MASKPARSEERRGATTWVWERRSGIAQTLGFAAILGFLVWMTWGGARPGPVPPPPAPEPSPAQPVTLPSKVETEVGKTVEISAKKMAKAGVLKWWVGPSLADDGADSCYHRAVNGTLIFTPYREDDYTVLCWTVLDGEPTSAAECLVRAGKGPRPPPVPPDPPKPIPPKPVPPKPVPPIPPKPVPPPIPDSPLVASLKLAIVKEKDGDKAKVAALAQACSTAAVMTRTAGFKDVREVRDAWVDILKRDVAPALPHVRGVVTVYLNEQLPTMSTTLTAELRQRVSLTFETLADALRKAESKGKNAVEMAP